MILEEQILAYLDGTLGPEASAELLHSLSFSPERRALLEEHLRMKDVFKLGQRPYAVPARTERELAERIPAVRDTKDRYFPIAVARNFFGVRKVAMALGMIAILAVGAFVWENQNFRAVSPSSNLNGRSRIIEFKNSIANTSSKNISSPNVVENNFSTHDASIAHNASIYDASIKSDNLSKKILIKQQHNNPPESMRTDMIATNNDVVTRDKPIRTVDLREPDCAIPGINIPHTMSEIAFSPEEKDGRFMLGVNASTYQYRLPVYAQGGSAIVSIMTSPEVTLDYELSSNFSVGLEGGQSLYAQIANEATVQSASSTVLPALASSNYERVLYTSDVRSLQAPWTRLAVHYSPNPFSDYPIRVGVSGSIVDSNA
jgi:hypothetical protein